MRSSIKYTSTSHASFLCIDIIYTSILKLLNFFHNFLKFFHNFVYVRTDSLRYWTLICAIVSESEFSGFFYSTIEFNCDSRWRCGNATPTRSNHRDTWKKDMNYSQGETLFRYYTHEMITRCTTSKIYSGGGRKMKETLSIFPCKYCNNNIIIIIIFIRIYVHLSIESNSP